MTIIEVIKGDITKLEVDAIVNAANDRLLHGGGVAKAISSAAGPELQEASRQVAPVAPGQAKATAGYNLPAKWVIHAVGPRWRGGVENEPEVLESAYRNAIRVADELGVKTLAFPSISTAIFGYPIELAAPIAMRAITSESIRFPEIELIQMCTFSNIDFTAYQTALASL